MAKKRRKKCNCRYRLSYGSSLYCLHQLFRKKIVTLMTREVTETGAEFHLWSVYLSKDKGGSGWNLRKAEHVQLAIDLAKKHKVEMRRI